MKVIEKVEVEGVTDVVCDVCKCSTEVPAGGLQFATLKAHWGYGSEHDGELYELHLCEGCFFGTLAYLRQERRTQNMFSEDQDSHKDDERLGMSAGD